MYSKPIFDLKDQFQIPDSRIPDFKIGRSLFAPVSEKCFSRTLDLGFWIKLKFKI